MEDDLISVRHRELSNQIHRLRDSEAGTSIARYDKLFSDYVAIEALEVQARLARSQEQLALAQEAATDAQMAETERQNQIRGRSDEQSYWSRRFLTSLTVAHGVGLVTCLTALTRQPPPTVTFHAALGIIATFGLGLIFMGSLPVSMARIDPANPDKRSDDHRLFTAKVFAAVSVVLLILGVVGVGKVALDTFEANATRTVEAPSATKMTVTSESDHAPETAPPPSPTNH